VRFFSSTNSIFGLPIPGKNLFGKVGFFLNDNFTFFYFVPFFSSKSFFLAMKTGIRKGSNPLPHIKAGTGNDSVIPAQAGIQAGT
jgi:hypothetical protein